MKQRTLIIVTSILTGVVSLATIYMMHKANKLIAYQNELIKHDIILNDANTKSSYVSLVDNLFEQINDARKDSLFYQKNHGNLFYKIILVNQRLKPYRTLKNGKPTERELSPERGLLLTFLLNEEIKQNQREIHKVFLHSLFEHNPDWQNSELDKVEFNDAVLADINLTGSSLVGADLSKANLTRANLMDSDLRYATMGDNPLRNVNLRGANLDKMVVPENWFEIIKKGKVIGYEEIVKNYSFERNGVRIEKDKKYRLKKNKN